MVAMVQKEPRGERDAKTPHQETQEGSSGGPGQVRRSPAHEREIRHQAGLFVDSEAAMVKRRHLLEDNEGGGGDSRMSQEEKDDGGGGGSLAEGAPVPRVDETPH